MSDLCFLQSQVRRIAVVIKYTQSKPQSFPHKFQFLLKIVYSFVFKMKGMSVCTVSGSRLQVRYFVAVPGNWLRRNQEKTIDIKEMNFLGDLRTDRQTFALVKFHLFFRRHGNWLNKIRYPSCLFLLRLKLFLPSFFTANPKILPLRSLLFSVAIDEQTWNIRQLGRPSPVCPILAHNLLPSIHFPLM
jgi:hypothetical protein